MVPLSKGLLCMGRPLHKLAEASEAVGYGATQQGLLCMSRCSAKGKGLLYMSLAVNEQVQTGSWLRLHLPRLSGTVPQRVAVHEQVHKLGEASEAVGYGATQQRVAVHVEALKLAEAPEAQQ
eukprot:TRINITY_DN2008_c0_g1_i73.p1 TRINITY_DN2008_c0_g1~~TRINITY_DN2008_c0_g1_i73.p1  ORF type:complete len:122 (-),score=29.96 TRINITY_DN2008_c0_g1_i73:29-394(-)